MSGCRRVSKSVPAPRREFATTALPSFSARASNRPLHRRGHDLLKDKTLALESGASHELREEDLDHSGNKEHGECASQRAGENKHDLFDSAGEGNQEHHRRHDDVETAAGSRKKTLQSRARVKKHKNSDNYKWRAAVCVQLKLDRYSDGSVVVTSGAGILTDEGCVTGHDGFVRPNCSRHDRNQSIE